MKKLLSLLFVLGLTLSACGTSQTQSAPPVQTSTLASTSTSTITSTATQTPIPPTSTVTPLPTIPTFTPTFDVSTLVTVTPVEKAECPIINKNLKLDFKFSIHETGSLESVNTMTLDFLNEGGSPKLIIDKIRGTKYLLTDAKPEERALEADVTGDGVPELLIAPEPYSSIFGCKDGNYQLIGTYLTQSSFGIDFKRIIDVNRNGIPEIYMYTTECMGGRCHILEVLEWNGSNLQGIVLDSVARPGTNPRYYCDETGTPFEINFHDEDKNGLDELIVAGKTPSQPDDLLFPYREETRVCTWNGQGFVFFRKEFSEPIYRFQALQDADLAINQREYGKALTLYERTISDKNLEWWSPWRRIYEYEKVVSDFFQSVPSPTPDPRLIPDPNEYPSLAAYAYYRILLIHLVQGGEAEAASTYQTLQGTFGDDPYAAPYVEMASAFWESYQSTNKMYDGCAAAIQYVVEHPEILTPLGSDYHGWQSHIYEPADVCPFR